MSGVIEDGTGTNLLAKVDEKHRLHVDAKTSTAFVKTSVDDKEAYYFGSGFLPISSTGSFSSILYVKNTHPSKELRVHQLRTCGQQSQLWEIVFNPTAGTIISDEVTGSFSNLNLKSSNTPEAIVYMGGEGKTTTGGVVPATWINNMGHSVTDYNGALILGKNDSIAVRVKPGASADVCSTWLITFEDLGD